MKKKLRGFYLLVSTFLIAVLNIPFAFAKSAAGTRVFVSPPTEAKKESSSAPLPTMKSVYDSLQLSLSGLSQQAY